MIEIFENDNFFCKFPLLSNEKIGVIPKILFRGCHVSELSNKVSLKDIQGRPEDTTYNGNIIHLTTTYERAFSYGTDNSRREQFDDKRVCVAVYDTEILLENGIFLPDIGEGCFTNIEDSINNFQQIRWSSIEENAQAKRLSAILFIVFNNEVFYPKDLDYLLDYNPIPQPINNIPIYCRLECKEAEIVNYLAINNRIDVVPINNIPKILSVKREHLVLPGHYIIINKFVFKNTSQHEYTIQEYEEPFESGYGSSFAFSSGFNPFNTKTNKTETFMMPCYPIKI